MVEARFGPHMRWIDTVCTMDDVVMESVLHPATPALRALSPHPRPVRFIVRKQGDRTGRRIQIALANVIGKRQRRRRLGRAVVSQETDTAIALWTKPDTGARQRLWTPGPGVAKPQVRQDMDRGRVRTTVTHFDAYADVFRARLGILDKDVKIPLGIEDARIEQLILPLIIAPLPTLLNELLVGIGRLGIFIEILHVGVRWRGIKIEIVLLHILAMIGLGRDQAKQPLFQNRVFAVPQCQGKDEDLVTVADTGQPILTPAVRFGASEVMGKIT